ncbi:MAG: NAD(P)/FAD-dependent oxidoreductase, partial [Cyclobacteriaceae bacterium]
MRIPTAADIVVIGGGPAGSMAAAMLSKKGYDVVLLEKEKHPRIKVGESLIPHFWKYCDLMGVTDEVEAAGIVRKNGGWILWEDELKGVSFSDYGFDRPGLHVERDILDNIFLKKSAELGTQVFEETMALKIEKVQGFWQTTYKAIGADEKGLITSKIVIDASGQSALTARQLGFRKFDEGFKFHSFWGYFEGGSYFSNELSIEPFGNQKVVPPATFISSLGNWGWSWQIPLQHKTSVGVVIPREDMSEFSSLGETLEERLINKVRNIPVLGNLMEGAKYTEGSTGGIKDYSYLPEKVAFENCFLIGDAAAFVDPINSAGVPIGMFAGYLASWAVDGILKNP